MPGGQRSRHDGTQSEIDWSIIVHRRVAPASARAAHQVASRHKMRRDMQARHKVRRERGAQGRARQEGMTQGRTAQEAITSIGMRHPSVPQGVRQLEVTHVVEAA